MFPGTARSLISEQVIHVTPLWKAPACLSNGTTHFKNVNKFLNNNIYSYIETSDGQSSNVYLNLVHFFNTSLNLTSVAS